jgi:hypothetical protein
MIQRPVRVGSLFALALSSLAGTGCSSSPSGRGDAAAESTGTPDLAGSDRDLDDPTCHWDCFGRVECVDGVVTRWNLVAVPCRFWTGSCPSMVTTCSSGCAVSWMPHDWMCPAVACRENEPKAAGDSCSSDRDCLPTPAIADVSSGAVTNVYLRCDIAQGRCVTTGPPALADWLAPCTPGVGGPAGGTGSWAAIPDSGCSGNLCLVHDDSAVGCKKNACTKSCRLDSECPPGAVCQREGLICETVDATHSGYCKPGARNVTPTLPSCSLAR